MVGPRAAWATLALASIAQFVRGELITVTEYPATCSAIYTSRTTTIIQSTVTVVPQPYDDAVNNGAPFIIGVEMLNPEGYMSRRQIETPSWVMWNGNTTITRSMAGTYRMMDGQLMSTNGSRVSTNRNVLARAFEIRDDRLDIETTFTVRGGLLYWDNPFFTNGTAHFYKLPPGLLDNALILARFRSADGERERGWSPINLYVELVDPPPPGATYPGISPPATTAGSVSVSDGVTITPPSPPVYTTPGQSSPSGPGESSPPVDTPPEATSTMSMSTQTYWAVDPPVYTPPIQQPTTAVSPGETPTSAVDSTQPTNSISPNGICGGESSWTCAGSGFGDCCSQFNFCGSEPGFCDPARGCQTAFGICVSPPEDPGQYTPPGVSATTSLPGTLPPPEEYPDDYSLEDGIRGSFGEDLPARQDDNFVAIDLDFPIRIYGVESSTVYLSTNGLFSILDGSDEYAPEPLPADTVPRNTIFPFWDDMAQNADVDPRQGIFYQVDGTSVVFEYFLSRGAVAFDIFQFTVTYDAEEPGVFVYRYFQIGSPGFSKNLVGTQGETESGEWLFNQYSYSETIVTPGLAIRCDTNTNTCEDTAF
ncbi:hypothetical protein MBLNU230_g1432t1 [Neophaeotheca triangularis]